MTTQTGGFRVTSWVEQTGEQAGETKLIRVRASMAYEGVIDGEGVVEFVMFSPDGRVTTFVGLDDARALHPPVALISMEHSHFTLEAFPLVGIASLEQPLELRSIAEMNSVEPAVNIGDQLVIAEAQHLFPACRQE